MVVGFDIEATHSDGQQAGSGIVGAKLGLNIGCMDDLRQPTRCSRSPPRPKSSMSTSKLHLPSRCVYSAPEASNDRAPSAAATESTWSVGT